jgi:tyrosyl-DNA phosphodiesterase-1
MFETAGRANPTNPQIGAQLIKGFQGRLKSWDGTPSGRSRATPHMKCYFRYQVFPTTTSSSSSSSSSSSEPVSPTIELSWFVLTSANLSQAAWGGWEKNYTQTYIKSYEMGVLYLPKKIRTAERVFSCTPNHPLLGVTTLAPTTESKEDTESKPLHRFVVTKFPVESFPSSEENDIQFPIPFRVPPEGYREGEDYPWNWDVPFSKPDSLGRIRNQEH